MKTDKDPSAEAAGLRRRAEELFRSIEQATSRDRTEDETLRLFHELQIHQIELEMQNQELRHAREEREIVLDKYTELYDFAPVGYFTIDREGTINAVNLSGAALLETKRSRLIGRRFGLFVVDETRLLLADFLEKVFASSGKESCEVAFTTEENSQRFVQLEAVADKAGEECRVAVIDITERRRAEEEREQLFLQLEAVLESINEGVMISDLKGNVVTMNREALALHGYSGVEQVRRQLSEYQDTFELFDLEGRPVPFEEWPLVRAIHGERFINYEVRVRRRETGTLPTWSYTGTPVRNASGNPILSVITMRDISERKTAEEEIVRLNADLSARAVDLEDANRELEAFNYTVAHDLRNPLNLISICCQALKELCGDKLDEQCGGYLQDAYDGTLRMNRLIGALLDFSRMIHVEPHWEQVDLSAQTREVAITLKQSGPERRVDFRIADEIVVTGDTNLLRVVQENLLGNAWKYTDRRDEAVIEFGTTEIDGQTAYFVRDNGTGFNMADAGKLFVPFQRLPGAETCEGFGIGLATVERIIRRHCGKIWAEGEPGTGATFFFTLQP